MSELKRSAEKTSMFSLFQKKFPPVADFDSKKKEVVAAHYKKVLDVIDLIEAEMKRIGYWTVGECPPLDPKQIYSGISYPAWLQFVFLPGVRRGVEAGDLRAIPQYRVGLAALRQYDYHSEIPEAHPLMNLCFELEKALPPLEELRGPNQPPEPMAGLAPGHGSS
ncbi:hypothetical protein ESB00_07050 [Oleiharenicola lentus]|jgi:uncharacterized protein YqcC (DUF446 family)|uniref:YqcC family protein n=1 Tax=Oleiharenicola lentus TaxID=2508720 RepID=A0A4Q1C9K3_9BACT|nr:hypothetical protein [Oleiharenicola lentus]RXK55638.1 hypothetical protein ESB00_07050 [Oleiharenicola lentus]